MLDFGQMKEAYRHPFSIALDGIEALSTSLTRLRMSAIREITLKLAVISAFITLASIGPVRATGILLVPGVLTYGEAITSIAQSGGGFTTLSTTPA